MVVKQYVLWALECLSLSTFANQDVIISEKNKSPATGTNDFLPLAFVTTIDGSFNAVSMKTGKFLWSFDSP
eukprot:Awhi_evm1s6081